MDFNSIDYAQYTEASNAPAKENALSSFARAAAYTGVQTPLNAFAQLPDKAIGTNLLPKVQLIDAPTQEKFLSVNWHAQQLGTVAGMMPWIMAVQKGSSAVTNTLTEGTAARQVLMNPIAQGAISGAIYGAVLLPAEGDGLTFVANKAKTAGIVGATMGTIAGSNALIGDSFGTSRMAHAARGGVSGVLGGTLNRELISLSQGNGLVADQKLLETVYVFGALGAIGGALSHKEARQAEEPVRNTDARRTTDMRANENSQPAKTEARINSEPTKGETRSASSRQQSEAALPKNQAVTPELLEKAGLHSSNKATLSDAAKPIEVEPRGGMYFDNAAHASMRLANQTQRTVIMRFNGTPIPIQPGDSLDQVNISHNAALNDPGRLARLQHEAAELAKTMAAERAANLAALEQLKTTTPRPIAEIVTKYVTEKSGDWAVRGVFELRHPQEILELAKLYQATEPKVALQNMKFATEAGKIAPGTEPFWRAAIIEVEAAAKAAQDATKK